MGYKSTLRTIDASLNKSIRENERENRRQLREDERLQKKMIKVQEKMEKILNALQDLYAKGKMTEDEYKQLQERQGDIKPTLIIFGKAPGVSLAKRYITGKIEKEEFEKIQNELLPSDLGEEEELILKIIGERQSEIQSFHDSCNSKEEKICQKCSKKGGFFSKIRPFRGKSLCSGCRSKIEDIHNFPGHSGVYFDVDAFEVVAEDSTQIPVRLKNEYF